VQIRSVVQLLDGALLVGVDADVRGDTRPFSTISRASRSVLSSRARAAAWAKEPPEPMAMRLCSGSMTSPLPEITSEVSRSATAAGPRAAQGALRAPGLGQLHGGAHELALVLLELASKSSNRVKASAVPPAKPARTWSLYRRRTLRALPFMIVLPMDTWPSPPMTTLLPRRTQRIVVPRNCSKLLLLP
jgi:hypothetical protein